MEQLMRISTMKGITKGRLMMLLGACLMAITSSCAQEERASQTEAPPSVTDKAAEAIEQKIQNPLDRAKAASEIGLERDETIDRATTGK